MMRYPVNNIYPTVQGEGVHTGVPMILLRLQGCGVGCPFCDTKETWEVDPAFEVDHDDLLPKDPTPTYTRITGSELVHKFKTEFPPALKWVMLTGGEPARLPLHHLVLALHDGGYKIALETSGTEIGHLGADVDWVCVSPKIDMPGGKLIQPDAITSADEIKMVIGKTADLDKLDHLLQTNILKPGVTICLQPMSESKRATAICIDECLRKGYRLSIQTHKLINIS
jgi:7-carboxy-7-deazaguanine synthase